MSFSKYLNGQEISGYTKDNEIFEGVVYKNNEGIRVAVRNTDGKWLKLTELSNIKETGKQLKEELENALSTFNTYYDSQFDNDAVKKGGDPVYEKIADTYIDSSDDRAVKDNKDEFKKAAVDSISAKVTNNEIKKGNTTASNELDKYKKDLAKNPMAVENNPNESAKITESMDSKLSDDEQNFDNMLDEDFTQDVVSNDSFDGAATEYVDNEIEEGSKSKEEIIDDLQTQFNLSAEDAENMYKYFADHKDDLYDDNLMDDDLKDDKFDIENEVDTDFEAELNNFDDDGNAVYADETLLERLNKKFNIGVDTQQLLNEVDNSVPDAVLKLAECEVQHRMNEIQSRQLATAAGFVFGKNRKGAENGKPIALSGAVLGEVLNKMSSGINSGFDVDLPHNGRTILAANKLMTPRDCRDVAKSALNHKDCFIKGLFAAGVDRDQIPNMVKESTNPERLEQMLIEYVEENWDNKDLQKHRDAVDTLKSTSSNSQKIRYAQAALI